MFKKHLFICINTTLIMVAIQSCIGQGKTIESGPHSEMPIPKKLEQIDQYVMEILEDSKGNIWIGTLSNGVAKYDGKTLRYYTDEDGLIGNAVINILEDKKGNLWFGTHEGLSKFDGQKFTNFTEKDGLIHHRISTILIDSKENFWIGTWGGVSLFDGEHFTEFKLPKSKVVLKEYQATADWITQIYEDHDGNIWFARDGYGADKYDGKNWTSYTKKDGLLSNNIMTIAQDKNARLWFGSRFVERDHPDPTKRFGPGGLNRYDGEKMINFPEIASFYHTDTYHIYEDNTDNI